MRIIEVREGFVKIQSNSDVQLASLLQIDDEQTSYIAQVVQIKNSANGCHIYAKILFIYEGLFRPYDKTLPSTDAVVKEFIINDIAKISNVKNPVLAGVNSDKKVFLDQSAFDKKLLVCMDSKSVCSNVVTNMSNQFSNAIVIDMTGNYQEKGCSAGTDFKLPLNTDSLAFLYEDCLNDATADSKALIKEIFQELSEYSQSVPFLPFNTLKTIVDDMVEKSHIFKLLVLKNKLSKFSKCGYFAQTPTESENVSKIVEMPRAVIDLSKLDVIFQNRYLSVICSAIESLNPEKQIFLLVSNSISKTNLKKLFTGKSRVTFVIPSHFKYINEIRTFFPNYIIEPSFPANTVFKEYSTLLSALKQGSYIVVGENTSGIPLISVSDEFDEQSVSEFKGTLSAKSEDLLRALESEQSLENDSSIEITNEDTPSINAINKKSEDLINQMTEEIQSVENTDNISLFDEQEELEDDESSSYVVEEPQNESSHIYEEETENNDEKLEDDESDSVSYSDSIESSALENDYEQDDALDETEEDDADDEDEDDDETDSTEEVESLSDSYLVNQLSEEELEETPVSSDEEGLLASEIVEQEEVLELTEEISEEYHTKVDENKAIAIPDDISEYAVSEDELNSGDETFEVQQQEILEDESELVNTSEEEENETVEINESDVDDFDEIIELDESEASEADIIVDFTDEDGTASEAELLDKEIVEDVDKVFTTMKDDAISDEDLDFIDTLNESVEQDDEVILSEGMEELTDFSEETQEEAFLEPLEEVNSIDLSEQEDKEVLETREASTPIVPVYEAEIPSEDLVVSDPIEQGDSVVHAKYGNGVVEKMIKYGNKTLYSINFDNVGRRLLDPTLTEIKKA